MYSGITTVIRNGMVTVRSTVIVKLCKSLPNNATNICLMMCIISIGDYSLYYRGLYVLNKELIV